MEAPEVSWALAIDNNSFKDSRPLQELRPIVERLKAVFGLRALATILNTDAGNLSRFLSGRRALSDQVARRSVDLDHVLMRAALIFELDVIPDWLTGNEPFLRHARPIDVLAVHGAGPLIVALDGIAAGSYA